MAEEGKGKGLLSGLGALASSSADDPLAAPVEESEGDAEMSAAQDLIDAVSSGSASAVKAALKASYDACKAAEGMMSDDEY